MIRSFAALPLLVVALAGCPQTPECTDNSMCGELHACINDKCKKVDCLASDQCEIEHFCSHESYTCEAGCEFNTDCFTEDRCDPQTSQCITRACRDSALDCPGGYRCDEQTGQCYLDTAPHCRRCSSSEVCGEGGGCYRLGSAGDQGYCFLACNPEAAEACPAGYSCERTLDEKYVCVGYCPLL